MARRLFAYAPLVGVIAAASAADAQQAGLLILEAPASTEAMAYGNTPYLYSRESGTVFYAPGLIARLRGASSGVHLYDERGTLATLSGATPALGGGLAVGLQYMRYASEPGVPVARDSQSVALSAGSVGVTELVGSLGYGRAIFGVPAGVVVKFAEQAFDELSRRTVAFDVGIAGQIGPVMAHLVGQNIGWDFDFGVPPNNRDVQLPTQVTAGLSLNDFQVGPLDMFVTARTTRRRDGQFILAGGLEISYWPVTGYTFRLRGGLQRVVEDARSPFTFGAAFTGDNITIEYAFQGFDAVGNAHRFGLRWR